MRFIIDTQKVVEVFCAIDDFCLQVKEYFASHPLPDELEQRHLAGRKPSLSESEVLTLLCLYHLSGFKCFPYYYERLVLDEFKSYFPGPSHTPIFWNFPDRRSCTLSCWPTTGRASVHEQATFTSTVRSCLSVITVTSTPTKFRVDV